MPARQDTHRTKIVSKDEWLARRRLISRRAKFRVPRRCDSTVMAQPSIRPQTLFCAPPHPRGGAPGRRVLRIRLLPTEPHADWSARECLRGQVFFLFRGHAFGATRANRRLTHVAERPEYRPAGFTSVPALSNRAEALRRAPPPRQVWQGRHLQAASISREAKMPRQFPGTAQLRAQGGNGKGCRCSAYRRGHHSLFRQSAAGDHQQPRYGGVAQWTGR